MKEKVSFIEITLKIPGQSVTTKRTEIPGVELFSNMVTLCVHT